MVGYCSYIFIKVCLVQEKIVKLLLIKFGPRHISNFMELAFLSQSEWKWTYIKKYKENNNDFNAGK